jgi:DedD protein
MADIPVSQEEQALRRRARRRLVGAIALALLAVVVLPMLFDPEPKPLGGNVEILIPGPDAPFEPTEPGLAPAAVPLPREASPPQPVNPGVPSETPPAAQEAEPVPIIKPAAPKPAPVKPAPVPKQTQAKPPGPKAPEQKPAAAKPAVSKPIDEKAVEAKTDKPSPASATDSLYLQLGAFANADNAKQLADKAKAAGFSASVVSSGGKSRVRIGPYADRSQALAAQAKLKAKGISSVLSGS